MKVCLSVCVICVLRMRGQTTHPIALKFGTFVPLHLGTVFVKKISGRGPAEGWVDVFLGVGSVFLCF